MPRALIATIPPLRGGVPAMLRTASSWLAARGVATEVAWYEPYSMTPRLSVPIFRLGTRRVGRETRAVEGVVAGHAIGAWLPELEFTHYWPTRCWRELIARADLHLVVSGSCLAGLAFARTATPFLGWIASDWDGDRRARAAEFPSARRLLDRVVVRPVARRYERAILRRGRILALSEATRRELDRAAGEKVVRAIVPQPVDLELFRPQPARVVPGRIGFVGRFDDPRKNLPLFLAAISRAHRADGRIHAEILSGEPTELELRAVERAGVADIVTFVPYLSQSALADRVAAMDVVAVTSHQEGLGIAALEAMAAGVPVVATRCGGPEDFVRPGENGCLTAFDADEIALRLVELVRDRELRGRCGDAARRTAAGGFGEAHVREILGRELDALLASARE